HYPTTTIWSLKSPQTLATSAALPSAAAAVATNATLSSSSASSSSLPLAKQLLQNAASTRLPYIELHAITSSSSTTTTTISSAASTTATAATTKQPLNQQDQADQGLKQAQLQFISDD